MEYRITPAGAGKTRFETFNRGKGGDHPRRCGENFLYGLSSFSSTGSPPQVRGKPVTRLINVDTGRITPAGAGKTRCWAASRVSLRDHPRRCGENECPLLKSRGQLGSPPQVRGKLQLATGLGKTVRITPAGAGKTFKFPQNPIDK